METKLFRVAATAVVIVTYLTAVGTATAKQHLFAVLNAVFQVAF